MKTIFLLVIGLFLVNEGISQVHVNGYYRKNGTYVQPHYRSSPDGNPYNNWSYPGNTNPYTGKVATGNPETYLANYYKTYSSGYSSDTYDNYNSVLLNTNYRGLLAGHSYNLTNEYGTETGYATYLKDRTFSLLDKDRSQIGYVVTNKNGKRYSVYDLYGYKVTSNKRNDEETALEIIGVLALGVLIGVLASQ